jgi:hypothetical protein
MSQKMHIVHMKPCGSPMPGSKSVKAELAILLTSKVFQLTYQYTILFNIKTYEVDIKVAVNP